MNPHIRDPLVIHFHIGVQVYLHVLHRHMTLLPQNHNINFLTLFVHISVCLSIMD